MFKRVYTTTGVLFFLSIQVASAQLKYLNLNVSLNGGYSVLTHKTDFQTTPLYSLYQFVAISHGGTDDYTWTQFQETYQIRESFGQPRMGFKAQLTYREWPIILEGEALSSPSAYTRPSYAATLGLGKNIYIADSSCYFSFLGGYKYVIKDFGFGANTITNSIGLEEARDLAAQFFGPKDALGRDRGDLFALHAAFAKTIDWYYRWSIGIEGFYEIDLTDKLVRSARMTNYGAQIFLRFKMFGKNPEPNPFYPNPGGGRRN
ncbi:MAG: hypothetical protein JNJ57_15225 [Saprospiraceae bacterium]|nr:hypothetical protein [Saprospiraceae bacterium]